MADTLDPTERSERMSRVRNRDTKPELVVRRLIFGLGYRYRLHPKGIPGRPDLAFKSRKKAIFVHGCFWHQHPDPECKLARMPKSRLEFWRPKLTNNRQRDEANIKKLKEMGWSALEIWECELKDLDRVSERVQQFLG